MTIRARLTFWYAAVLLAALLLVSAWTLYEFREQAATRTRQPAGPAEDTSLEEAGEVLFYGGVPALALALASGWFLMRRALAPVTRLTEAAEKIHATTLQQQLPRSGNGDELDRLTEVFNAMTRRLHESFQRVQEFTLHASHELNTPLTVMRGELESALQTGDLRPAESERIADLLDEVERLTQIVDSLTFLSKADAGLLKVGHEPVRLDELVRDGLDDAQVLAQPRQVQVRLGACEPTTVPGDRRRLRQLLLILTDNAVKYNQAQGTVTLALRAQSGVASLTVANTGPGMPPEMLGRAFDRFFRGDASHNKEVDGSGLGLSIAQWIVKAHAGSIHIASELNRMTTVTVLLPLDGATAAPKAA
jgi:signal transduction histidine kinase